MISFKKLEEFLENSDLTIVLKKTSTGIAVSVLPKPKVDDKSKENLIPFVISGPAEELDQEFMTHLGSALQITSGITTNISEFEAQAKEMKAKSEAEKNKKEQQKKLDEKAKKTFEGAKELFDEGKIAEAEKKVDKALEESPEFKTALTLKKKINTHKVKAIQAEVKELMTAKQYDTVQAKLDEAKAILPDYKATETLQKKFDKVNPAAQQVDLIEAIEEEEAKTEQPKKQTPEEYVEENAGNLTSEQAEKIVEQEEPQVSMEPTGEVVEAVEETVQEKEEEVVVDEVVEQIELEVKEEPKPDEQKPSLTLNKAMELYGDRLTEQERTDISNGKSTQDVLDRLKAWYLEDQAKAKSEKQEEVKPEVIQEEIVTEPKPVRADFESIENFEKRVKMWEEKYGTKEDVPTESAKIEEIAEASDNVKIVTLPKENPQPEQSAGITPNTEFDNEGQNNDDDDDVVVVEDDDNPFE